MASSIFISPALGITNTGAGISFASPILAPMGTTLLPGIAFATAPSVGITQSVDQFGGELYAGGGRIAGWYPNNALGFYIDSVMPLSWRVGASNPDVNLSRLAGSSLALGNGTFNDFSGTLKLATLNATSAFQANGTPGVTTFGPSAVTSITVKQGIITAIS